MVYKIIELLVDSKYKKEIDKIAERKEVINIWQIKNQNKHVKYSLIVEEQNVEMIVDNISKVLNFNEEIETAKDVTNTMMIYSVEGFLPKIKSIEEKKIKVTKNNKVVDRISLEEMYDNIVENAKISQDFILNILLATIVCSVGIIKLDFAVLIAASAIAPLLGSIIGYSFSISTGDDSLMKHSLKTLITGLLISIGIGVIIGFIWNYLPDTYQINMDKNLFHEMNYNHYAFILALASGASAGLAVTAGTPILMVSFMVAVALLPNIAITGITLGSGFYNLFINSLILLFINITCIIFTSQMIFAFKKVRPKTKEAIENAKDDNIRNIAFCIIILGALIGLKILV